MSAVGFIFFILTFVFVYVTSEEWKEFLFFVLFFAAIVGVSIILYEVTEYYYKVPGRDIHVMQKAERFEYSSNRYRCSDKNNYYTVLMKDSLSKPTRTDRCIYCYQVFRMHSRMFTKEEFEEMNNEAMDAILCTPAE